MSLLENMLMQKHNVSIIL